MKNILLSFVFIFLFASGYAQNYQRLYPQSAFFNTITSGLVSSGFNNGSAFNFRGSLNITDSLGNIVKSKPLSPLYTPSGIYRTTDGGYLLLASQNSSFSQSASLIKCDSAGNTLWQILQPANSTVNFTALKQDNAGNFYLIVDSLNGNLVMLKKYDASGTVQWVKNLDPQTTVSFTIAANGNVLLLGKVLTPNFRSYTQQLDVNGDSVWQQNYTHPPLPSNNILPYDVVTLPSGGFVSLYYQPILTSWAGVYSCILYKSDVNGALLDSMSIPGFVWMNSGSLGKLGISADGSVTLFTTLVDTAYRYINPNLFDISTFGQINWQRTYINLPQVTASDICPLPNGFLITGFIQDRNTTLTQFIDRLDLTGQFYNPTTVDSTFFTHSAYRVLDTNNIAAGFNSHGDLFSQDTIEATPSLGWGIQQEFRVPKSGPAHAIFLGNIWIAGKNNGNLYSSSESYTSNYQAGPAHIFPNEAVKWNTIWAISRTDALSVKDDFDAHHAITRPIPASVLTWPAKGNANAAGYEGAPLTITQDMAPFVDRNGDGIYNVYDGDYPLVKGDKMLWWINNDQGSLSQNPMDIERRYSVYEYNSLTDSNLNNTLFLSVSVKNQSNRSYDSVKIGSFIDFDLGCANNDRTGSIPSKNTFFVYNGYVNGGIQQNGITCDEGPVCPSSEIGYGCTLPIMSATFLNDTMRSYGYLTNGASSAQADPTYDSQYYNYMNGQWDNGSPYTLDGTGYGGTTPYPYAFPGNPADASQWSECNQQITVPIASGDRRSIAAIGPFALAAGDTLSFDMAFIFHPGPFSNCPDISDSSSVYQHIDSIVKYYGTERFPQWFDSTKALLPAFYTVGINEVNQSSFKLIPNPNNGTFTIHTAGLVSGDYTVTVTDMLGRVVYINNNAHTPDQTIQLSGADSGVYSVTLESQNFKSTKKVVITSR